jgi:hypothetical protein
MVNNGRSASRPSVSGRRGAGVRENPQFDPNGHFIGRCEMIMGLLYKTKKKGALAVQHLTEAKRIASQFGPTPMLARIDAELAELA